MDARWTELAAGQDGAISRPQLLGLGLPISAVDRLVRRGLLQIRLPGVYVVAGSPDTMRQRRWVALLAVGTHAVVSFESAARDHGLATVEPTGPHVFTVPHSGPQRLSGVVVHQISDVAAIDVVCLDGFRTTTVERTIVDLAAIWRRGRIRLVLDDAVASKKTTIESVGACLQRVARRGKPGVALLTSVLEEHSPGEPVPNSVLEADLFRLLRRAGLPMPSAQYPLPRDDGVVGLADGAWIEIKLIVEVDGRRWHQRIQNMKKDRDRDIKAAAEGWQVIRPLHEHVVGAPEETARELRTIIATRSQQLGVSNPTGISI